MRKKTPIIVIILAAVVLILAQQADKLRLIQAGKLEQFVENGEIVKRLNDDIHFRKGKVNLYCQIAYWYENRNQANFIENVKVTKDSITLTSDSLVYFTDKNIIRAYGNPVMEDSSGQISADTMIYYVDDDLFFCHGNVHLKQKNRNLSARHLTYYAEQKKTVATHQAIMENKENFTTLASDSIIYFNDEKRIRAYLDPVLTKEDTASDNETKIFGAQINGGEKKGRFTVLKNVRIVRDEMEAYADHAEYSDSTDVITLTGNPHVINEGRDIYGDRITAQLKNGQIKHVNISGNAIASSINWYYLPASDSVAAQTDSGQVAKGDSIKTRDEMTGNMMDIHFRNGNTDSIRVSGMATSYYNVAQDSIIKGVNQASGDTIIMHFDSLEKKQSRLHKITVSGGTEGNFTPHESNTEMDTSVVYSAGKILYFIQERETWLIENADTKFKDMELSAGKIDVLWNKNMLYATPLPQNDTTQVDSTDRNMPTFKQKGQEPFTGRKMAYNLKTRKGRILRGRSHSDDAYYHGKNIMKTDKETFYIADGKYTTCELDTPHYSFRSQKMKLIDKDKIVARPLILHIHDIPIIGIPFAVVPKKGGRRHSGWIMPSYGDNKTRGPHIRGLGYFWAINDYTDFRVTTDFFTNRGIRLNYQTRYKLRYVLNGNISGFFENSFLDPEARQRIWKISINHSQQFSPTMRLNINGSYVSQDDYYQKNAIELEDRLNQQMISNASFSKNWRDKPYSFSMNARQTINLQAKNTTAVDPTSEGQHTNYISRQLPNISFNHSSKPLFPAEENADQMKWFNKIYFSYNSRFRNKQDIYYKSQYLSPESDSLIWKKFDERNYALTHNISLNSSQKIFSYFSVNQSVSLNEDWIFEYEKPITDEQGNWIIEDGRPVTEQVQGFLPRHTGSASLNLQTKLYGLFPVNLGGLSSLRHIATPRAGLSYSPDFTKEIYGWDPGYIMTGQDSAGNPHSYDPFSSTMVGSTPSYESRSLNFGLSNVFQAKIKGEEKDKKVDLLNLDMSSGYNFVADSLKLAPVRSSIRTSLGRQLNVNISLNHDFYAHQNNRRINDWNDQIYGIPIPELRSVSARTSFSLKGHRFSKQEVREASSTDTTETSLDNQSSVSQDQQGQQLWSANFSLRYSKTRYDDSFNEKFFTSMNVDLSISENWSVGYRASFDLLEKKLENHSFNIKRDLHCWQMSFNWTPSGYGQQYHLLINIKSSALKDLKYEEKGGRMRTGIY
ncbi:MAG TPA: putative LPS assembly protein LptD [bacterium]|nr:putative LPS assembly protein LptD [bacterium]